jgi:nucleoside-diphosphate-sugar epimerase
MRKIFITGIGGCVGHYLFDVLVKNQADQLYLLVRNPVKLKFDPRAYTNVTIINDDLKNIDRHAALVRQMDCVIHLAADWAGNEGNYDYTLALLNLLDPEQCRKVIYFSTASILGPDNRPVAAAEKFGTHYIRSKYRLYQKLPELKIQPRVITLFPTWVLGGDARHPYSHALQGIKDLKKWLWLIRFFTVEASFHFIHARDIAAIVNYLLDNETKERALVLGNAPTTARQLLREICAFYRLRVYYQIPISARLIQLLAFLLRRQLHPWDLYSFNRRHFVYQAVNAPSFGLSSDLQTIGQILELA